jgi:hypothetical protein
VVLSGCEAVVKLTHKHIRVLSHDGQAKVRSAFGYFPTCVQENIFFYNNNMSVVLRALTERLYYVKSKDGFVPCPKPTVSFHTLKYFLKAVKRSLPEFPSVWTNDEFVQSYTGSKRRRYEAANANLARRGLKRQDGYLGTFIKCENYNGTTKCDPCPRLIQPRSAEYNISVGRYLRPAEKLIYKAIDRVFGHHVVLKCDNMVGRADQIVKNWEEFENPCFVGLDASRFDQHVSKEALEFEHSLYNMLFKSDELAQLLTWQVHQKGFANCPDGAVMYTVEGCRASGDMNTALGNVLIMCALCHNYLKTLGVHWRFINDGDDCGIFIERKHLELLSGLPAHHLAYGFEMEVEPPVFELEHIEFCQCHPVHLSADHWMMVRNVKKAMAHDWISLNTKNFATTHETLVATARCGLALYADVPILGEMYLAMSRFPVRENIIKRLLQEEHSGLGRTWRMFASSHRAYPVDETIARVSMYKAFGILPDDQAVLESHFRAFDGSSFNDCTPNHLDPQERSQYYLQV